MYKTTITPRTGGATKQPLDPKEQEAGLRIQPPARGSKAELEVGLEIIARLRAVAKTRIEADPSGAAHEVVKQNRKRAA